MTMKVIASSDRTFKNAIHRAMTRSEQRNAAVENSVRTILKAVERGGDAAVARYSKKFDRVTLKPAQFRVTQEGLKEAYYQIRKDEGDALRYAAQRIMAFHDKQRTKTWMYQDNGATLGQVILPLDAVGIYVPGGKAAYPSSVLMTAIPRQSRRRQAGRDVHAGF
jgi:histidinol dehydrogenase